MTVRVRADSVTRATAICIIAIAPGTGQFVTSHAIIRYDSEPTREPLHVTCYGSDLRRGHLASGLVWWPVGGRS